MTIHIDSLQFDTIIGLLDFERITPQRIVISLQIDYEYTEGLFLNYADIASVVKADILSGQYTLLEDALLSLKALLFEKYPAIERLGIRITKPDILPDCSVALSEEWIAGR